MTTYQCYPNFIQYQKASQAGDNASALTLLRGLCANRCSEAIPSLVNACATLPPTPPVSRPSSPINQWFNTGGGGLPEDCASLQSIYTRAAANDDYATAMEAAAKLTINNCSVPNEVITPDGFNCDVAYRIYYDKTGMFNEDARAKAYASLVTNNCPQVTPGGSGPPKFDCASAQQQYLAALKNGQDVSTLYHVLKINGCAIPDNSGYCNSYMQQFNAAYAAKDVGGMQAAIGQLAFAGCALPPTTQWNPGTNQPVYDDPHKDTCDLLSVQYSDIKYAGGDVSGILASMCAQGCDPPAGATCPAPPSVNPCTGEQSLTAVDYLFSLPLKGIEDDPILATAFTAAGGVGAAVLATVFVPEAGKYVRIPAIAAGAYSGLVVNGILDNYAWIANAKSYGIVFGSLVTGLGAVSGIYQSIHNGTEKFLKTELGGAVGEVVYKVGEGVLTGGLAPLYDMAFGDKTWSNPGYNKAKCLADCGNPKLSSTERKLCKLGARLDLKF